MTAGRLAAGVGLGLVAGLIGAFVYAKIVFYTHINVGYFAAGIGWLVGMAVHVGCRRGGIAPGIAGGLVAAVALVVSRMLLLSDELVKLAREGKLPAETAEGFLRVGHLPWNVSGAALAVRSMDPIDWIIFLIGVYGGFSLPFKAGGLDRAA